MADAIRKPSESQPPSRSLFDELESGSASDNQYLLPTANGSAVPKKALRRLPIRTDTRAIQDLLWAEAILALESVENFTEASAFQHHLEEHLPQNSCNTRIRYAQAVTRWFFPDGVRGLVTKVWLRYRDRALAEEIMRYLYLRAEPMVGAVVSDALQSIADGAVIPASYLPNFIRGRFGKETPDKTIHRIKGNLRKLGFLIRGKGNRDVLRTPSPSLNAFVILLHHLFASQEAGAIEFAKLAADPFWKYLGLKSEDQVREALKASLKQGILAKYVLADRIESISFRHTFSGLLQEEVCT